jgi:hypothetical protein
LFEVVGVGVDVVAMLLVPVAGTGSGHSGCPALPQVSSAVGSAVNGTSITTVSGAKKGSATKPPLTNPMRSDDIQSAVIRMYLYSTIKLTLTGLHLKKIPLYQGGIGVFYCLIVWFSLL